MTQVTFYVRNEIFRTVKLNEQEIVQKVDSPGEVYPRLKNGSRFKPMHRRVDSLLAPTI